MKTLFAIGMVAAFLLTHSVIAMAQQAPIKTDSMPGMQMHGTSEGQRGDAANFLPAIGGHNGEQPGPTYELQQLEARALQHNPTLPQAEAAVGSAEGRKAQAGAWPNPTVGYLGDEIAGGLGVNGGRQGGFVEQTIVLGRKLYLAQQVAGAEVQMAELAREEQRYRVQNAVRSAYFRTLAAQELVALADQYVKLASESLETSKRLRNAGARDESEVMMAEIELERARLSADLQLAHLREEWENLRSVVGDRALPIGRLNGKLDADLPRVDSEKVVDALIAESPAMKIAKENQERAAGAALQAKRQTVPDLSVKVGLEQNQEQNDVTGKPFGLEGFAEVRVELPIFNRNQGNSAAARAEVERSRSEILRVELQLRQQAAAVVEQYETARSTVDHYQDEILPRSRALYDMQVKAWQRMALSYPQVLLAQQNMFTAQGEYIRALEGLRTNAIALSGFLLTDGLSRSTVRETDLGQ